jgi:hypothetical protein
MELTKRGQNIVVKMARKVKGRTLNTVILIFLGMVLSFLWYFITLAVRQTVSKTENSNIPGGQA